MEEESLRKFVFATGGGQGIGTLQFNGQHDRIIKFSQNRSYIKSPTGHSNGSKAYGRIEFAGCDQAKPYVLVPWKRTCGDCELSTNPHVLLYFVEGVWKLNRPRIMFSITGETEVTNPAIQSLILGLIDTARQTKAWILTDGLSSGVAKQIGAADFCRFLILREYLIMVLRVCEQARQESDLD